MPRARRHRLVAIALGVAACALVTHPELLALAATVQAIGLDMALLLLLLQARTAASGTGALIAMAGAVALRALALARRAIGLAVVALFPREGLRLACGQFALFAGTAAKACGRRLL